jgi:hydrogenase/urease accessory protein HupE
MKRLTSMIMAVLAAYLILGHGSARAHDTPIAVLQLKESANGRFLTKWIFESSRGLSAPNAIFPPHCTFQPPLLDCGERGLAGTVTVEKLGERYSGAIIQLTRKDGATRSFTLTGGNPSVSFGPGGGASLSAMGDLVAAYIAIGFEHILLGVDHLMFVAGLIWLLRSRWTLVKTITAFTVAHSITLAAATLGWVGVPERGVNAAIALSIVFIGVEIVKQQRGEAGLTVRYPWLVAFAFGLLHGFGFSTALTKLGLPQDSIVMALLSFNVGVEIGQIAFVCLVLAVQWAHRAMQVRFHPRLDPVPAYAIGTIAMFWFLGRMNLILFA